MVVTLAAVLHDGKVVRQELIRRPSTSTVAKRRIGRDRSPFFCAGEVKMFRASAIEQSRPRRNCELLLRGR